MNKSNFLLPQGYKPVFIALGITVLLFLIDCELFGFIGGVITLLLTYIYRNTSRYVFENSSNILSSVDGKVIAIDKNDDKVKIYVRVGLLDNHMIRSPFKSNMKIKSSLHGLNLDPLSLKGTLLNEQMKIKFILEDEHHEKTMKLQLMSGFFNPKISIESKQSIYEQGEKVGVFVDGIAIISLKTTELFIQIGDRLKAGQTIITKI